MTGPTRHPAVIDAWNRYVDEVARADGGFIDDRTAGYLVRAMADDLRQALGLPPVALIKPERIDHDHT